MTNLVEGLRRVLQGSPRPVRGTVVKMTGDRVQVRTREGVQYARANGSLKEGDAVRLENGNAIRIKPVESVPVYWV